MGKDTFSKELTNSLIKILALVDEDGENIIWLKDSGSKLNKHLTGVPLEHLAELEERGNISVWQDNFTNEPVYIVPLGKYCDQAAENNGMTSCINYDSKSRKCRRYNDCYFQNMS